MGQYAKETTVSVEKSRAEIETILHKYGATAFAYARNEVGNQSLIEFIAHQRRVRFVLPMPERKLRQFTHDKRGYLLVHASQDQRYDQACRQRWRALVLAIRAKLEAVESQICEFESEFLANIVDPASGRTVGEVIRPKLEESYQGKPQQLLLTSGS